MVFTLIALALVAFALWPHDRGADRGFWMRWEPGRGWSWGDGGTLV